MTDQSIEQQLSQLFADVFQSLEMDTDLGRVTPSNRPELGQFQCNGALPAAKRYRRNPLEIANEIAAKAQDSNLLASAEVTPPGFINLKVSDELLAQTANQLKSAELLGIQKTDTPLKTVIDYGGPNAAKPLHVGHLRPAIIGESLKRIFRKVGHDITGDIHLGDWGIPMGMMIEAIRRKDPSLPYFDENFTGPYPEESPVTADEFAHMYPEASTLCKSDAAEMEKAQIATVELQQGRAGYYALWKHIQKLSIDDMKPYYDKLGVEFDIWNGESDAQPFIPDMIKEFQDKGYAKLSQGAWIVPFIDEKGNEQAPMILLKSDGAAIYATTDLATIKERVDIMNAEQIIYVVDNRQNLHFKQVFNAAQLAGYCKIENLKFAGFGTVNGTDGKPFKTRDGGVMRLGELLKNADELALKRLEETGTASNFEMEEVKDIAHKVAIAAIKFADLHNDRAANYIFDLEKFSQFEGKTGPYLLYSAVRMKSILRKAKDAGLSAGDIMAPSTNEERDLILAMANINKAVESAIDKLAPHHLCDFSYNLSQAFSRFYNACHIMAETDSAKQQSWLALTELALKQQELILELLGIELPERM